MTRNIFVMTGSGISAESGVQTYRSDVGLWAEHSIQDVATPAGFARNPDRVRAFYDLRRAEVLAAAPNAAHIALAELQADPRYAVTIMTQNVDDLHERAGSTGVLHIHGKINTAICTACGDVTETSGFVAGAVCRVCGGPVRPDIVWFGERPQQMDAIEAAFLAADTFLCIGTSGQVWPAAGYARRARNRKYMTVEFNVRETEISHFFRERKRGQATRIVPEYVNALLKK